MIAPYLDAVNIDLKSFSDNFYRKNCGARLKPVLDSIKLHKTLGIWTEITTLIIPTLNDSEEEMRKIAEFIKNLGEERLGMSASFIHYISYLIFQGRLMLLYDEPKKSEKRLD